MIEVRQRQTEQLTDAMQVAAAQVMAQRGIPDVDEAMTRAVESAVATIRDVTAAGISHTTPGRVQSGHATSSDVACLNRLQEQLWEGPCITAAQGPPHECGVAVAHDLASYDHDRWPNFAPRAVLYGYRSAMSVEFAVHGPRRGSLNLYARDQGVFGTDAQHLADLFRAQVASFVDGADAIVAMKRPVGTARDVIRQARSVLREQHAVGDHEAFDMLVLASRTTGFELVEIARWLCAEGNQRDATSTPTAEPGHAPLRADQAQPPEQ